MKGNQNAPGSGPFDWMTAGDVKRLSTDKLRAIERSHIRRVECAFALSCGVAEETLVRDRDYGERTVELARRYPITSLHALLDEVLTCNDVRSRAGGSNLFRAAVESPAVCAASFSTVNLPGILGNVANKVLLDAFASVDATYDLIAEQADFSNFQIHTMYRLDHLGEFALVTPAGELHHGSLGQTSFTNQLNTAGQILTLSRQSIINDDLNAFRSLPAQLARKARIAVEKALYSVVCEASDSFYTTGQGNRFTSSSLGITQLGQAESALVSMADAYGDPIYAVPKFLIVPPTLKFLADSIFTSEQMRNPAATQDRPVENPYRGRFTVVSSPYLQSAAIPGSSTSTWYLSADPLMLPAWQLAYLDGERAPTIQTADALFNTLGLQMRVFFDFGVAQLDYRGAIKSTA
jgi:hypothetical protein